MRLGILEAGRSPDPLGARHGHGPEMFDRLLRPWAPELRLEAFAVLEGRFPDDPSQCDAWLITGSKHGAYDPEPWIPPLEAFLRRAYAEGAPLIGVCFGHQILAQALGGRVEKSSKGWGLGAQDYALVDPPRWMREATPEDAPLSDRLTLLAMHQDQVIDAPPEARLLAGSDFCPNAAFIYGDPERPSALSVQPHPEFDAAFERDLIMLRRGDTMSEALADAALASLERPVTNATVGAWFAAFLRGAAQRRRDAA